MALIWVAEDEPGLRDIMAMVLAEEGHEIRTFPDGKSILAALGAGEPEMLVLDVGLPDTDGLDICRLVRENPRLEAVPIIIVTGSHDTCYRYRSLVEGADDFLTKPFDNFEFVLRVRNRLRRSRVTSRGSSQDSCGLELSPEFRSVKADDREVSLTECEFAIAAFLVERAGRPVSARDLLVGALGFPQGVGSPDLVRTHIHNLRQKIEEDPSHPRWVRNVPRLGYMIGGG